MPRNFLYKNLNVTYWSVRCSSGKLQLLTSQETHIDACARINFANASTSESNLSTSVNADPGSLGNTNHWQQIMPGNKWSTSRGEQRVQLKSSWETLTSYGPPRRRLFSCLGLFIIPRILDACTRARSPTSRNPRTQFSSRCTVHYTEMHVRLLTARVFVPKYIYT